MSLRTASCSLRDNLPGSRELSWFDIQDAGPEALRWRLAMLDTATTSIDAQYFIWKQDAVGSLLMERLLHAADRGVRVRLLIADGQVAIVGGRNIASKYFDFNREENFRDFDVLTTGKVLPEVSSSFDGYWNSGWSYPITIVDHQHPDASGLASLHKRLRSDASVLDDWQATADTDPRSMVLNTEVSLMIDSPELARGILAAFAPDFLPENSWQVTLDEQGKLLWQSGDEVLTRQPAGSIWKRLGDTFFGLLPIDTQM